MATQTNLCGRHVQNAFDQAFKEAAQPQPVTSNAVSKLSEFIKQCAKSKSSTLQKWAYSEAVVVKLFDCYVEWDESDQRRSTKVLLDLVVQLLKGNPDREEATRITSVIMMDLMSIIRGTSTKPIIKSAVKASEYFLSKGVISLEDVVRIYKASHAGGSSMNEQDVWPKFFAELLQWLRAHTVCPLAGKFVVGLYRALRAKDKESQSFIHVESFKGWLLDLLFQDPTMLEPIKNYVFGPLFKGDRQEAIIFLRSLDLGQLTNPRDANLNVAELFQIAALEAGKRVGLVEEPGTKPRAMYVLSLIHPRPGHRLLERKRVIVCCSSREDLDQCTLAPVARGSITGVLTAHHITFHNPTLFNRCVRSSATILGCLFRRYRC